ncbi:hypothetical protein PF008_g10242 [Phytophthora fragariae]|uniref:Uncharacterized protein n=1 Tax=Phytophthora fragariae TaxID=53985 RepID=A0A6G0RUU1_9STRA|nr:hypothetical protein PF008_g10242 [Phytophthora fragariae]
MAIPVFFSHGIRPRLNIVGFTERGNDMSTSDDGQAPNIVDDMEMAILIATDSGFETETDSASSVPEEDTVLATVM